ncbi:tetratricopeptide repeat protein 7B-like [Centruroides sculpturatus]|uniref:tetratricopeptide repeat protein 7B-like n=1 Tax=Centruroides sculpturatus TaxID=218467 RepID=UPI000C6E8A4E|nr:tetratricopeptide repeat protein 7B-like [Centruroides sculpturatus]
MTSKPKTATRLESDIEKNREESNWRKVIELAEQLSQRNTGFDTLVSFLIGESKLEQYLEEYVPVEQNVAKAKTGLTEAKRYLVSCLSEQGAKLGLVTDTYLLLSKLLFAQGYYDEALNHLAKSGLDKLAERQFSNRIMKIVAESFAIKGLCLEKVPLPSTSKYKAAEREDQVIKCFVTASDLTLRYLQEVERTQGLSGGTLPQLTSGVSSLNIPGSGSPLPPNTEYRIGPILETALQRAPILYIKNGKLPAAIEQYRKVLNAVETSSTQSLRQTMSRQLAEVLLRGVSEQDYSNYLFNRNGKSSDGPWKPRKYSGQSLFCPKDENEEILLLLFISEAMVSINNKILLFRIINTYKYHNTNTIYSINTVLLIKKLYFNVLINTSFERAMKFAFEEFHIWFQFALSLTSAGKHNRAYLVLQECIRLQPNNPLPCLIAARICYENLNQVDNGLKMSEKALERELSQSQGLLSRCHLFVGVGLELMSEQVRPQTHRQQLRSKAFDAFLKAQAADPNDHLPEFYLALHYAHARQLPEAILHAKSALYLRGEHVHSLHLLVLLLSAQKQYWEALQLVEAALEEYPDNFNLMYTKAHLELHCVGGEVALLTSKQMLQQWKTLYEKKLKSDMNDGGLQRVTSENKSVFQLHSSELSDGDSGNSVIVATRIEQALSEVASSVGGFQPKPGPQTVWLLQLHIWLLIAELYLHLGQVSEAEACIHEASSIFPLCHQLMVMKGMIHKYKREYHEAKTCFQNAVAINPLHVKALQHLGLVYHNLGSNHLAEKTLRDAVTIDPMSHQSWFNMGKVLQDMGDYESASECLATAIELEATSPILPLFYIPHCLE